MGNIMRMLAILCILFGAGAIVASAQINSAGKVNVPFSFTVDDRTYDAGVYNLKLVRSGTSSASLAVQRQGAKEIQTVLLREFPGETAEEFRAVFGGGEGSKFLAGITTGGGSYLLLGAPQPSAAVLSSVTKRAGKSKM